MKTTKLTEIHNKISGDIHKTKQKFILSFVSPPDFLAEMVFCICTPQTNAKKAWEATQEILTHRLHHDIPTMADLLGKKGVRFKNNKAWAIREVVGKQEEVFSFLHSNRDEERIFLRNEVAAMVHGYGLKEASHFLRNVGLGDEICILDRHIMRCLAEYEVIPEVPKTITRSAYFKIEKKMLSFSKKIGIPPDDLDFVFWYHQNGEIFK